jgi:hypothetical protein
MAPRPHWMAGMDTQALWRKLGASEKTRIGSEGIRDFIHDHCEDHGLFEVSDWF